MPSAVARAWHEARDGRGPALVIVPSDDWAEPADDAQLAAPAQLHRGRRANTYSTVAGLMPTSAPADAIIRNSSRRFPLRLLRGPRILIRNDFDNDEIGTALASGLIALCGMTKASSAHVTFAREAEWKFLAARGFLQRTDQQFHWRNEGYRDFEDFLATLNSRHRKAIKRERREALASGITIHALNGSDITEDAWDAFFAFYMETGSRKWGRPYLTRAFFSLIGESMAMTCF